MNLKTLEIATIFSRWQFRSGKKPLPYRHAGHRLPFHQTHAHRRGFAVARALASIGLTLWVTWQLEGGAAAVNEAGRMRMQTWRLASAVQALSPPDQIAALVTEFDQSLAVLRKGDPARPLFVPWDVDSRREFAVVENLWRAEREALAAAGAAGPGGIAAHGGRVCGRHQPVCADHRAAALGLHGHPEPVSDGDDGAWPFWVRWSCSTPATCM